MAPPLSEWCTSPSPSGWQRAERHDEGVDDELGVLVLAHRPADQAPVAQVPDPGHVELALAGRELGDVRDPSLVRALSGEVPLQPIRCRSDVRPAAAPLAACARPCRPSLAHQPGDPLAADPVTPPA